MKLYERVRKSANNKYGIEEVIGNPFLNPCVLLIMSSELYSSLLQPINGGLKKVLQMARILNNSFESTIYNPYDFPIRFIAVHARSNFEYNWQERLVNEYFSPLFSENEQKIPLEKALKNVRNLNIVSFCGGIDYCYDIEEYLTKLLKDLKYDEKEINKILNEVFFMGFSSPFLKEDSKFTSVIFNDLNDSGVYGGDNVRDKRFNVESKEKLQYSLVKAKYGFRYLNKYKNQIEVFINSSGEHSFRTQYLKEKAYFMLISMILSSVLNNSLLNSKGNQKSIKELIKSVPSLIEKCLKWEEMDITKEELEFILDDIISYIGVEKKVKNNNDKHR